MAILLLTVFFCSGAAALGYQIVWAKTFSAAVGHEFPSVLAVVTAFMAGMAVGAYFYRRVPKRIREDSRAYSWLEFIIAGWGALTSTLVPLAGRLVTRVLGIDPPEFRHWAVVFLVVFLTLLPATASMGATLPALERFLTGRLRRSTTALLYSANTAGSVVGAIFAAFWLIRLCGLSGSILALSALNLVCAIAAYYLASETFALSPQRPSSGSPDRLLVIRLFLTGLLGIGFETLIVRSLSHVLENTVYSFAVVLAIYLFGHALGAALFQRLQKRAFCAESNLLLAVSVTCTLSGLLLKRIPLLYPHLREEFGDSIAAVALAESLTAGTVFLLPAIGMGATFAALAQRSLVFRDSLSWSVTWNLLGAALGPLVFGFVALPVIGLKWSLAAVVVGYLLLIGRSKLLWALPAIALSIPWLTSARDLIERHDQKIISLNEGVMGSVAVLESTNGARVLKVNNRFQMGGTAARIAEERHADVPLLLQSNPQRALFIGLGTGITFSTAANYPDLIADGVELLPEIVSAMPLFQQDSAALNNPRLRVHVADGRRFVFTTTNNYDVIVGDLFHPSQDGVGFLFTREHFRAVRDRLAPGGLYCQWLPVFQMDLETLFVVVNTFASVFESADLWLLRFNVNVPVVGMIGWNSGRKLPQSIIEEIAPQNASLREHLRHVALDDSVRLLGCYIGSLNRNSGAPINTDDRPIVIFNAPRFAYRRQDDPGDRLLKVIERFQSDPATLVQNANEEFLAKLRSFIAARDTYLGGLVKEEHGDVPAALAAYIQSARQSSEFTAGYAQALALASSLVRTQPAMAERILQELIEAQPARPVAREMLDRVRQAR